MFFHESRLNCFRTVLACAVALASTGCAKAALTPTEVGDPSTASDAGDDGEDSKVDAGQGMPLTDSGMTPATNPDAGSKDSGAPDSSVPDAPCNIAVSETFDVDDLFDRDDDKLWSIANVGTSYTWYWDAGKGGLLGGGGGIEAKTGSASKGGLYLVNSYDKKTPFDARLISPSFAIGNCKSVSVAFDHYLSVQGNDIKGSLQVRIAGGDWINVQTWASEVSKVAQHEQIDLSSYLIGKGKTFQLAFRYEDPRGVGIYWQLDDLKINAVAK